MLLTQSSKSNSERNQFVTISCDHSQDPLKKGTHLSSSDNTILWIRLGALPEEDSDIIGFVNLVAISRAEEQQPGSATFDLYILIPLFLTG